jgi:hypothetical protein
MNLAGAARSLFRKSVAPMRLRRHSTGVDAFLASYPKSGRTWFRFILANYFARVTQLDVTIDLHNMFSVLPNFALDNERGLGSFSRSKQSSSVPLVCVTHLSYRADYFRGKPVIFLVRDPRDVLVSSYFHATKHKHRFSGTISEFLADPKQGVFDFANYMNAWAVSLNDQPHIIVTYEGLQAGTANETEKVLRFLNLEVDRQALDESVLASRFEAMRDMEKEIGIPEHDYDRGDTEGLRMRRGKVHGFTDYLGSEELKLLSDLLSSQLVPQAKTMLKGTGFVLND